MAVGSIGSDGGLGTSLGKGTHLSKSDATPMGEACDARRSKPMFCTVGRRPSGDCALRSCTACAGIKSSGIRACRSAVKKAGISACHAAYALSTHCRTRSRMACQCRSFL